LIKGNKIENMGLTGIRSGSDPTTIANNILIKTGIRGGSAIFVNSSSPAILGNIVDGGNGSGSGIQITGIVSSVIGGPMIGSNLIRNCGMDGIAGGEWTTMTISGNTIHSNGGDGIRGGYRVAVSGNIIRSNGGDGIQFTDGNGSITGNAITANTGMCINIPTTGFMLSGNFCGGNIGDP
jgi:hypothetical protein